MRRLAGVLALVLVPLAALAAGLAKAPQWASLSADQQNVLAPLKRDWNRLTPEQRRKWIGVAKRYPKMTPIGQKRVQTRMRKWAELTPQQRELARQRYRSIRKIGPARKDELQREWAEYQALRPDERRMYDVPPGAAQPAERKPRKPRRSPSQHLPPPP